MRTALNVMLKYFLFSFNLRLRYHLAETRLLYRQVLILALLFGLIAHNTYKFGELIKPEVRERHHMTSQKPS